MSPLVCERLGLCPVVYAKKRSCDIVAQGSLLNRFHERFFHPRIHVWGTGFIEECRPRCSQFRYHAVRGKLSAGLIRDIEIETLGDPGLLANILWPNLRLTPKRYRIGIVPHYSHRADEQVRQLCGILKNSIVIDVFQDVEDVLRQIASCEFVLSSSLHGLVVADSFGVPNAWIKFAEKLRGDDFKFRDYYSVFDINHVVQPLTPKQVNPQKIASIMDEYNRPRIGRIKGKLIQAFPFKP